MNVENKVWLDDQIDDANTPMRHPPTGWIGVKSALSACRLLARGGVVEISLDHDLGDGQMSGYVVARFIEKRAYEGRLHPIRWTIHSANPVGMGNMRSALQAAERFWQKV